MLADLLPLEHGWLPTIRISDTETAWLRKAIFADSKVDDDEKRLLRELKAGAKSTGPAFAQLLKDCGVT